MRRPPIETPAPWRPAGAARPARPGARAISVRIGDRERAAAAERLSAHAAAGRLSIEELEQRLEHVHAAVFAADLAAAEADLPSPPPREPAWRPPVAAIAIACLLAAMAASVLVGHPFPPLLLAAFLLWRAVGRAAHPTWRSLP